MRATYSCAAQAHTRTCTPTPLIPSARPACRSGFISTPSATDLHFDLSEAVVCGAAASDFTAGTHVGLLGLEHETRRRNRANGRIYHSSAAADAIPAASATVTGPSFTVAVEQSFGNCPKYIQKRDIAFDAAAAAGVRGSAAAEVAKGSLTDAMVAIVRQAGII